MGTVIAETRGRVRIVTLDRPESLNAFNAELFDDLADAFLDATVDDDVRVLVLTGAGRAFSAGADLTQMGDSTATPRHGFPGLLDAIVDFPKPFVLAINGVGVGIGATIAGLADLTFMAEDARLRCPFAALGLTAEAASTYTFPRLLGPQRAMWFLMSSEWMEAEQCVEAGLALEVCEPGALLDRTLERASALAELPPASLAATKRLVVGSQREQLRAAIRAENEELDRLLGGPANREAIAAFREKRSPDFSAVDESVG
ncbi:MAG: enoyl-CoA hydratase/isomerase family protein [Actinomycetota bacterium]